MNVMIIVSDRHPTGLVNSSNLLVDYIDYVN